MSELIIQTFGFPDVLIDGQSGRLKLLRGLALLVYLAEADGPVARDVMATLLWPESAPAIARARLRRLLHRIEQALGARILQSDRETLRLAQGLPLRLDSRRFEQACDAGQFETACRIYCGDFLTGFALADCAAFDEWAFFRREALRSRLVHALERLIQDSNAAGEHMAAAAHAARLVELDPLSEIHCRHLIRSLLLAGDRSAAERHYAGLERRLREELGIAPEEETQALMHGAPPAAAVLPPTRYANSGGIHLAFQVHGAGAVDILLLPGFVSHVERAWEEPHCRAFLRALTELGRVIVFDRRGVGMSDRIGAAPSMEATAEDIGSVLRAAQTRRTILFGASEGAPACIKFAAEEPRRVAGLILFGAMARGCWAPDYPFSLRADQYELWLRQLVAEWGGPAGIETFAPSLAADPQARSWWAGLLRAASSPGAIKAVLYALRDTDVRPLLSHISSPTLVLHRRGDRAVRIEAGRHVASGISGAKFVELDGADHWFFAGAQPPVLSAIRQFIAGLPVR